MIRTAAFLSLTALAACVGNGIVDESDTTPALVGAGTGAVAGEVLADEPIAGAAVGAGAGVVANDL